ncbi:hypothetical protein N7D90_24595 (plasmid) [Pseudomonas fragi]|uniref:hypothetical protein n=1 Tax=Pseudomonas fragi TaxID=296 RepID=UPI0021C143AC|nr:hypothetical protein [Pseudomonas fragi]UXL41041.1 hypothetical protein N7D90_24595 [Pseudomonas fragi]
MFSSLKKIPVSSILSIVAAMVGFSVALYSSMDTFRVNDIYGVKFQVDQVSLDMALAETAKLKEELRSIKTDLKNVTALPPASKLAIQLQQTQSAIKQLASRQEKLEQVILANPAKALEIPLLQRDLENVKAAHQANLIAVKEGVDRIYDLNKWLLGAMAISIMTLAISNFLKGKEPTDGRSPRA